jgi:hypothetical protein
MPQRTIGRPVDEERSAQTRPSPTPIKITVYRTEIGLWRFTNAPGRVAVEASLMAGARVGEDRDGVPCIFDPSNSLIMTADEAVRVGLLMIPIVQN